MSTGLLITGAAVVGPPIAYACIHVPRTYKGTVTEKTKEALLFHDGVNAHLIIRTNLQAASGTLPETMAWVIPLPSLPSHYEEADPGLFPEMFNAVEKIREERESQSRFAGTKTAGSSPPSIRIHAMQTVGSYQVQPIEVLSLKKAGGELNRWLAANGYGAVPLEVQRPYLKKGAVFLALKIHGLHGGFSDIKPLHIVYHSDTLSLPLKFSSNSGVFDVEMYAFTAGPLNGTLLGADHLYADPSVKIEAVGDAPRLWQTTGSRAGYLTRFEGENFNIPQRYVRSLVSDPTIDPRKDNAPHPELSAEARDSAFYGAAFWRVLALVLFVALGFMFRWWRHGARPTGV